MSQAERSVRRFTVDEVQPARERLPTQPLAARHPDALAVGGNPSMPVIDHGGVHPLLAAVGLTFDDLLRIGRQP